MTFVSRAEQKAARRRRRRHNAKMAVAGFCLTAGVLLAVILQFRVGGHRAADAAQGPSTSPRSTASVTPSNSASVPVLGSGSASDPGPAAYSYPGAVTAVLAAATSGIEAVDSYDYHDINAAIARGLAATTGQFQTSYRSAMTSAVAVQAPQSHTVQTATVRKLGVSTLNSDQTEATVLVIGRLQTTDDTTGTTPRVTPITLGVTLLYINGNWLISAVADLSTGTQPSDPPGSGPLQAATRIGAQEVLNLLTFSRSNYTSDFGRALAGLTGPLLAEQESQRVSIFSAMNTAGIDYVGEVRAVGIELVSDDSVTLLVVASSYGVNDSGKKSLQSTPEIEVGVVRVNGQWLVDQFLSVASS